MKIKVSRSAILNKLRIVSKVIRPSKEFGYNSFHIEVKNEHQIIVTAVDTSGMMQTAVDVSIDNFRETSFLLDAQLFMNGLREIPEQPIEIEIVNESKIVVNYQNGKFEIAHHNADLFPKIQQINADPVLIECAVLGKGFNTVTKFASKDDLLRPVLDAVNLSFANDTMTFVGTTGNALAMYEDTHGDIPPMNLNVPSRYAKIVTDLIPGEGSVALFYNDKHASFEIEDYTVTYRLVEGIFPNFRSVIPTMHNAAMTVNCDDFASALSRVSLFSSTTTLMVVLEMANNKVILQAEDIVFMQHAKEEMFVDNEGTIKIGFNSTLLTEVVKAIGQHSKECRVEFGEPNRAAKLMPATKDGSGEVTTIIMPLALNN